MKNILCLLITIFALKNSDAQKVVVANVKMNVVFIGLSNPLRILVEGYKCEEYELITDNGKIEKSEEDCTLYYYHPQKPGYVHIIIKAKKTKGKIIDSVEFRVSDILNPTPKIGGQKGGILRKKYLLVYMGISADMDFDFDFRFIIQKYTVAILRNNKTIFKGKYSGPLFSDGLKEEFKKTQQGDKLLIYDITTHAVSGDVLELSTMEFTIIVE